METTKEFYGKVYLNSEYLRDRNTQNPMELEYYKTKRANKLNEEKEVYGVEIVKNEYNGKEILTERNSLEYLTDNENTANKIIEILKDNTVTPISLNDVINDMFYE